MPDDAQGLVAELLGGRGAGTWVGVDVVMLAFGLSKRRSYELAAVEQWRTALGQRPKQYAFADVQKTWKQRRATAQPAAPITKGTT